MDSDYMNTKRPFLVTTLVVLVLLFTIVTWFGFFEALQQRQYLRQLPLTVSPLYLILRGAFWGLVGIALIWGLWFGHRWAWFACQIVVVAYALFYWLDRFFLATSDALAARWPFQAGMTVGIVIFCFGVLWLPASRRYFGTKPTSQSAKTR
jgi:hypothetical protein